PSAEITSVEGVVTAVGHQRARDAVRPPLVGQLANACGCESEKLTRRRETQVAFDALTLNVVSRLVFGILDIGRDELPGSYELTPIIAESRRAVEQQHRECCAHDCLVG